MKRNIALAMMLFALSGHEIVFAQTPLFTAPLGVQTYTFRRSFSTEPVKTLDTIKMMGFTEIEGFGGRLSPEELKKLCDERDISIPSTGADYEQLVKSPDSVAYKAKIL